LDFEPQAAFGLSKGFSGINFTLSEFGGGDEMKGLGFRGVVMKCNQASKPKAHSGHDNCQNPLRMRIFYISWVNDQCC
jgi:hypothetical protein